MARQKIEAPSVYWLTSVVCNVCIRNIEVQNNALNTWMCVVLCRATVGWLRPAPPDGVAGQLLSRARYVGSRVRLMMDTDSTCLQQFWVEA